jgi:gentisate 1,2-dioxygenase
MPTSKAGIRQLHGKVHWARDAMIHYRGADVREALDGLRKEKGDPHEGIQLQFVNPATGGPVGSTLDYAALREGPKMAAWCS